MIFLLDIIITMSDIINMIIEKKAMKALRKMPRTLAKKFYAAFEKIEAGNVQGLDVKAMKGHKNHSRLRIGGYRAIYTIDMEIIVITVGARGDVYK